MSTSGAKPTPKKVSSKTSKKAGSSGESAYGVARWLVKKGKKHRPNMITPKEFTRFEIAAIGCITIQWAYLEHMLLLATAELVAKAKIPMPYDALTSQFERRIAAYRSVVKGTVTDQWTRTRYLDLAQRISNAMNDRHRITHGLWDWNPATPQKIRAFSFRPSFEFSAVFDQDRLSSLADRIGEINYELTYPPRRGLKKLPADDRAFSYISRQFLLLATGATPESIGLYAPPPGILPVPA